MVFACCCSSPDCTVNGCAEWRRLRAHHPAPVQPDPAPPTITLHWIPAPPVAPVDVPSIPTGWRCPVCHTVNAPAVKVCQGCPKQG